MPPNPPFAQLALRQRLSAEGVLLKGPFTLSPAPMARLAAWESDCAFVVTQAGVMVPGSVRLKKTRSKRLQVRLRQDSSGSTFELDFGMRQAEFTLQPGKFRKLQWR